MAKLAVFGVNSSIARHFLGILAQSGIKKSDVVVFTHHMGEEISFGEEDLITQDASLADWKEFDRAVFIQDEAAAQNYAVKLKKLGLRVINATEALRDIKDFALTDDYLSKGLKSSVSLPSPMTAALLKVLRPLNEFKIKAIHLNAYIGADIAGDEGLSELYNSTRRILMNDTQGGKQLFVKPLAFNVIPQAGSFIGEETEIEWMFNSEIKQLLGDKIKVHANCAMVPVFIGIGMFVNIETSQEIDVDCAYKALKNVKGVEIKNTQTNGDYAAITDTQGETKIFISRLREDLSSKNGISLWLSCDTNMAMANDLAILVKK